MKTGRLGILTISLSLVLVVVYGLRVYLLPIKEHRLQASSWLIKTPLSDESHLPDFSAIKDVKQKKQAFFDYLRPAVQAQNAIIAKERDFLESVYHNLQAEHVLTEAEKYRVMQLAEKYELTIPEVNEQTLRQLLTRVDLVPENMVLIQAANETGWGSSRFAQEGLNFFGQWCFKSGCGLVPLSRNDGMHHEVAKFDSVDDSVASYLRNLNSNNAYRLFRQLRAKAREQGHLPSAEELIPGLKHYSERKGDYVTELLQMLKHNQVYLTDDSGQKARPLETLIAPLPSETSLTNTPNKIASPELDIIESESPPDKASPSSALPEVKPPQAKMKETDGIGVTEAGEIDNPVSKTRQDNTGLQENKLNAVPAPVTSNIASQRQSEPQPQFEQQSGTPPASYAVPVSPSSLKHGERSEKAERPSKPQSQPATDIAPAASSANTSQFKAG